MLAIQIANKNSENLENLEKQKKDNEQINYKNIFFDILNN